MSLALLTQMSNRYGADPRYVLAGGGNTSYKEGDVLYIKGSGAALATIRPEQFVRLDRGKLAAVWDARYPEDFDAREAAALKDLMDARLPGESGRPSVETLLHDIIPYDFVCHLHPGIVNALTCARDGQAAAKRLFPEALWVPAIMPGYVLAAELKRQLDAAPKKPHTIFLENHGVFVGGDTVQDIDQRYAAIMTALEKELGAFALPESQPVDVDRAAKVAVAIRMLFWQGDASFARFLPQSELCKDRASFEGLCLTLTPDHMVYCGQRALWVDGGDFEDIVAKLKALADAGEASRVIGVQGLGLYALGGTLKECDSAYDLLGDALSILEKAKALGGANSMPRDLVEAIGGWEVERYRKSQVLGGAAARAAGKIALVTGGAQGFGLGIAQGLIKAGAAVAVADINADGAEDAAKELCAKLGAGSAYAITADVGDAESVRAMIRDCALRYGGLDALLSNAGIVRAGGLDEMTLANFELSTKVNYTAFFLCAKYAAEVMRLQRRFRPEHTADIVQINSKSGLSGSNRNFAYAGAKFGGIGLVQSFALELVEHGIKVNAVCPGNFLDGPLWADPDKGLFVQYLRAGKVPGAKTVDDVRRYYESRVPMGRGCRIEDVLRAILYVMEQQYETGQAIPVTGGQEMLH